MHKQCLFSVQLLFMCFLTPLAIFIGYKVLHKLCTSLLVHGYTYSGAPYLRVFMSEWLDKECVRVARAASCLNLFDFSQSQVTGDTFTANLSDGGPELESSSKLDATARAVRGAENLRSWGPKTTTRP